MTDHTYRWWTIWAHDGRTNADPHHSISPGDARATHRDHLTFRWAEGLGYPSVSDLEFHGERGTQSIQPGGWRDAPGDDGTRLELFKRNWR